MVCGILHVELLSLYLRYVELTVPMSVCIYVCGIDEGMWYIILCVCVCACVCV